MSVCVILDGVDGCGKSTQARMLVARLEQDGRKALHLREPGSTAVGEALRRVLLESTEDLSAEVEVLLFAAARAQLIKNLVTPALERGEVVVCERGNASTFAYQGVAGELGGGHVLALLETWAPPVEARVEVVLEVDPREAAERRSGETEDRIEAKGLAFQERVAAGYQQYTERVACARLVDARGSEDEVFERVWSEVNRVL